MMKFKQLRFCVCYIRNFPINHHLILSFTYSIAPLNLIIFRLISFKDPFSIYKISYFSCAHFLKNHPYHIHIYICMYIYIYNKLSVLNVKAPSPWMEPLLSCAQLTLKLSSGFCGLRDSK